MTPFLTVRDALAPCRTMTDLSRAWAKNQTILNAMERGQRNALIAMKDWYKGMIKRGEIDAYLSIRNAAAEKNKVSKPPDQVH